MAQKSKNGHVNSLGVFHAENALSFSLKSIGSIFYASKPCPTIWIIFLHGFWHDFVADFKSISIKSASKSCQNPCNHPNRQNHVKYACKNTLKSMFFQHRKHLQSGLKFSATHHCRVHIPLKCLLQIIFLVRSNSINCYIYFEIHTTSFARLDLEKLSADIMKCFLPFLVWVFGDECQLTTL